MLCKITATCDKNAFKYLNENAASPRKQKGTAKVVPDEVLLNEGFPGFESRF